MDRRMYRGNMRNNYRNDRDVSPYRANNPVCDDGLEGYTPEDSCERGADYYADDFESSRFPIGMCYVPWQRFRNLYENEFAALANATLFKELDYDWYGRGCK